MNHRKITQGDLVKAYFGNKTLLKEIALHIAQNWDKRNPSKEHWNLSELSEQLGVEIGALKLALSRFDLKGNIFSKDQIEKLVETLKQKIA